jgi:hypothetical protein
MSPKKQQYGVGDVMTLACPNGQRVRAKILRFIEDESKIKKSEIEFVDGPRKGEKDIIKSMRN